MTRIVVSLLLSACAAAPRLQPAAAEAPPAGIPEGRLGLARGSVFDVNEPVHWGYAKESPGGNDLLPRAYPGAPPRVPHDVSDYLPITLTRNRCLQCHGISKKKEPDDPTPIPQSHYVDLRNAPGVIRADLAGARFVCTSCHVPQSAAQPPVGNRFEVTAPK